MQPMQISSDVRRKLKSVHHVSENEIYECFKKRQGIFLIDDRAEHATEPATWWFVERTRRGRKLKIIFLIKAGIIHIKSAYTADKSVVDLYRTRNEDFFLRGAP